MLFASQLQDFKNPILIYLGIVFQMEQVNRKLARTKMLTRNLQQCAEPSELDSFAINKGEKLCRM